MITNVLGLILAAVPFISNFALGEESKKICSVSTLGEDGGYYYNLARYHYFETKCYRKAMHCALYGANLGSSDCMLLLRKAYGSGLGVVQDTTECVKWLFLASALGNEEAREEVKKLDHLHITLLSVDPEAVKDSMTTWNKAKKNARKWMHEHSDLFFNLN